MRCMAVSLRSPNVCFGCNRQDIFGCDRSGALLLFLGIRTFVSGSRIDILSPQKDFGSTSPPYSRTTNPVTVFASCCVRCLWAGTHDYVRFSVLLSSECFWFMLCFLPGYVADFFRKKAEWVDSDGQYDFGCLLIISGLAAFVSLM